jgi:hypothetical protein
MTYDFRSRFNLSPWDFGEKITWLDAVYLTAGLFKESDSRLQAAANNWKYPISRQAIILTQIFDLLAMSNSKRKPKPYPMPWPDPNKKRLGSNKNQSRNEVIDALKRMNPNKE